MTVPPWEGMARVSEFAGGLLDAGLGDVVVVGLVVGVLAASLASTSDWLSGR
jgi:hypothetical protein